MCLAEKEIRDISHENAVIIGSAADYILRTDPSLFSVFINAPYPVRKKRCIEEYGTDEKDADRIIEYTDKSRALFYAFVSGREWGECRSYNLSLYSSLLGIEKSVDFIIGLLSSSGRL